MAILVSGASGFLGNRLVARLIEQGRDVVALSRQPRPEQFANAANLQWYILDIAQDKFDVKGLPSLDAVVHLAGATLGAGTDEHLFLKKNEETTLKLLQATAQHCKHFVMASSQVVYGNPGHLAITEAFPLQPDGSAYACSKLNSENWIRWFQKRYGGTYLLLRFCGFIDGGGLPDYIINQALSDKNIELFSQGRIARDYLPSAEGIDAIIAALDYRGAQEVLPVNIGSGQILPANELAQIICNEVQSQSAIKLLQDPAPQNDFVFDISRAKKLLGFAPGNLSDAIRTYAEYRCELTGKAGHA
jgi:nucleoside-diphosphate-sugar epimerase